jgi:hypothetical protein
MIDEDELSGACSKSVTAKKCAYKFDRKPIETFSKT